MSRLACSALTWSDLGGALLGSGGDCPTAFRDAFALSLGVERDRVWLTGSGRVALHTTVQALGLAPGAEVLLPGYTCVVVPNVFRDLGLRVRYVDLVPGGFNPSEAEWCAAIDANTRAVVVPHNFGFTSDCIPSLRERFPALVFIEDAAHAWGSRHPDGRPVGTTGHAAFFSFEFSKCLTTGLGGALVVNDPALRPGVRAVAQRFHGLPSGQVARIVATLAYHLAAAALPAWALNGLNRLARAPARRFGLVAKSPEAELRGEQAPDYFLGLTDRLACVGLPQARRAAMLWQLRRDQARQYGQLLAGSTVFKLPTDEPHAAPLRYPLRLCDPARRQYVLDGLRALDIEPGLWFDNVVHPSGSLRYGYRDGDCPRGEALAKAIVNLPLGLHAGLTEPQWAGLRVLAGANG